MIGLNLGFIFDLVLASTPLIPLDFNSIFIRFIISVEININEKLDWHHGSTDRQDRSEVKNGAFLVSLSTADVYFSSGRERIPQRFGYSLSCDITVSFNFKQTTVTVNCLKYLVVILMMDHMILHHVMSHDVTWCIIWCIMMSEGNFKRIHQSSISQ